MIEELLNKIHEAKQEYLQGNDVYDILNKMDIMVSKEAINTGLVDKMSKSDKESK